MPLDQPQTSYKDDYTWPVSMPVKIFNTDYSCPKEVPKKIGFEPTKEFATRNLCKPKAEKSPQLLFINICEAKEVNFQNISSGKDQTDSKPQNQFLKLRSDNFNFNIIARPKTSINPNCHLSQFSCEKRTSNPDLKILVNHVNKSKNITNCCKCSKNRELQIQQSKPCSNQVQQPKLYNNQVQRPKIFNNQIPKTNHCNTQNHIQQSKPKEASNAKNHELKVCPNYKELHERKQPPANKLDVKMDPCEAFPDDHWTTTYQEQFGFVEY